MKNLKKILACILLSFSMAMLVSIDLPALNLVFTVEAAAKINKESVSLLVGQTTILKLTGSSKKVKWTSSNSSVAEVDSAGKVKARSSGTANITAKVGGAKFVCKVTVKTDIYKVVTLNFSDLESWRKSIIAKELELTFGGKTSLPDLNGNTYYTGNIIRSREVLEYKTVEARMSINAPGTYQTVKLQLPKKIKYQLHRHSKNIVGGKEGLGILFSSLVEGNVSWKARCSCGLTTENSWTIPTSKDMIKAASGTTVNSKSIVSYNAKYYPVKGSTGANSSIKLNKNKATIYTSGTKTIQLKATVKGKSKKVVWKTSNKKVATVNSKGKVTAKKTGKVTITAKANGKTAKCVVTVKKNDEKVVKFWTGHTFINKQYEEIMAIRPKKNGVDYEIVIEGPDRCFFLNVTKPKITANEFSGKINAYEIFVYKTKSNIVRRSVKNANVRLKKVSSKEIEAVIKIPGQIYKNKRLSYN